MEFTINRSADDVFQIVKKAIKKLDWRIEYKNEQKRHIEGSTGGSFLSWGESININVKSVNGNSCKVKILSEAPSQLFSWGVNSKNEQNFKELVKELAR